jgi:predicted nucleic acid-binding protein
MAANVLVDAGFLVALLARRDANHDWAVTQSPRLPPPWKTCEAALSEAFHLLGPAGSGPLGALLERRIVVPAFNLSEEIAEVVKLTGKYEDVPMSLADACLVRMTETITDPVLLTTDEDFRIYRRHGRRTIPCVTPL